MSSKHRAINYDSHKINQELIEKEYHQLSDDWRQRDQYILNKFIPESVLLASVIIGVPQITKDPFVMFILFLGSSIFSFVLTVSITKDKAYLRNTQEALQILAQQLHIPEALARRTFENPTKEQIDGFICPRRIHIDESYFTPTNRVKNDPLKGIKNWVFRLRTFDLVQKFQWIMTLSFFILAIIAFVYFIKEWPTLRWI
jgi:hypothetical protein